MYKLFFSKTKMLVIIWLNWLKFNKNGPVKKGVRSKSLQWIGFFGTKKPIHYKIIYSALTSVGLIFETVSKPPKYKPHPKGRKQTTKFRHRIKLRQIRTSYYPDADCRFPYKTIFSLYQENTGPCML